MSGKTKKQLEEELIALNKKLRDIDCMYQALQLEHAALMRNHEELMHDYDEINDNPDTSIGLEEFEEVEKELREENARAITNSISSNMLSTDLSSLQNTHNALLDAVSSVGNFLLGKIKNDDQPQKADVLLALSALDIVNPLEVMAAAMPREKKYRIDLVSADHTNRINAVKAVREITKLSLKESKDIVDNAANGKATTIAIDASLEDICRYRDLLEGASAAVFVDEMK